MQLNSNPLKVALITVIITLILIGVYAVSDQDVNEAQTTLSKQTQQEPLVGKDPFKEYLDKQQQGTSLQASQARPSQTIQIGDSSSAKTVPVGTDPFKAFLDTQTRAKPEEAAISPFTGSK